MIKADYIIKKNMMYMVGFYNRDAKVCTLVRESNKTFVVEQSPHEILDASIKKIGYTYKAAMQVAKEEYPGIYMCPILVNPIERIVLFPTQSPNNTETLWINPKHVRIMNHSKCKTRKTWIKFTNDHNIVISTRLSSFTTKLHNALQYLSKKTMAESRVQTYLVFPKNKTFFAIILSLKPVIEILDMIGSINL